MQLLLQNHAAAKLLQHHAVATQPLHVAEPLVHAFRFLTVFVAIVSHVTVMVALSALVATMAATHHARTLVILVVDVQLQLLLVAHHAARLSWAAK